MKTKTTIFNSDTATLDNREPLKFLPHEWITIWMVGEVPYASVKNPVLCQGKKYAKALQVTTLEDLTALCDMTNKLITEQGPLLVDEEHFSHQADKSSAAFAWAVECKVEDGKLLALCRFTTAGEAVVSTGVMRYCSPVIEVEFEDGPVLNNCPRAHPVVITGIGLTNTPRNKALPPISEALGEPTQVFTNRDTLTPASNPDAANQTNTMDPKLIEALGLGPDATVDDAVKAIMGLKTAAEDATKEAAETVVNAFKDAIPEGQAPFFLNSFKRDSKGTLGVLEGMAKAKPAVAAVEPTPGNPAQVFNRQEKETPTLAIKKASEKEEKDRTAAEHLEVFNSMTPGADRSAYYGKFETQIKAAK